MSEDKAAKASTVAETGMTRSSDREVMITRLVRGPARLVFEAWARPELFSRWWVPASFGITLISLDADVRTGGSYRLVMGHASSDAPMAFFGRYLEVTPPSRIVWTNDEGETEGSVTTVTFEDRGDHTQVTVRDLFPSKAALDEAIASGSLGAWDDQLRQLEELVATLPAEQDRGPPSSMSQLDK